MRPYLRENVDTPPFWLIFYQNADPPYPSEIPRDPPPKNYLSFIYTPPKIGENGKYKTELMKSI